MNTKKETAAPTCDNCAATIDEPGHTGLCEGCRWSAKLEIEHDNGKHKGNSIDGCMGCAQDAEDTKTTDRWLIATKVSAAVVTVHIWGQKPRREDGEWVAGDLVTVITLDEAQALYGLADIRTDRPTKVSISRS